MQRLRSRSQFQRVLAGQRVSATEHFVLHCHLGALPDEAAGQDAGHRIGALIPKRWARRAVTRNLIRRQIYAVVLEELVHMVPAAYVVRLRAGFARAAFVSAESRALRRCVRGELLQLISAARTRKPVPAPNPTT